MPVELDRLTSADFRPLLHQTFLVPLAGDEAYPLELFEIQDLGEAPGPEHRPPFSLLFRNPRLDAYLPQQTHELRHPEMEGLALFLVPLGPQGGAMVYQAILA